MVSKEGKKKISHLLFPYYICWDSCQEPSFYSTYYKMNYCNNITVKCDKAQDNIILKENIHSHFLIFIYLKTVLRIFSWAVLTLSLSMDDNLLNKVWVPSGVGAFHFMNDASDELYYSTGLTLDKWT